jgi:hypothetical protein
VVILNWKIKLVSFCFNFLEMENYNNANKLSMSVFDDFEKQTSWQSYTTLLVTDVNMKNDSKKNY